MTYTVGIFGTGVASGQVVDCLETGEESQLSARRALNSTEAVYGGFESSQRYGRVEFPLDIDDNPIRAMIDSGDLL